MVDLKAKGITNAAALLGGFQGWQSAGLPVDGTAGTALPPAITNPPPPETK